MLVAMVGLFASSAQADAVTLQNGLDGYTGTEDTMLLSADGRNFGGMSYMEIKEYSGSGRGLVRFDLSDLDITNLDISSATFSMYCYQKGGGGTTSTTLFEVSSANGDWVEGTGTPGTVTGASTWSYKHYTTGNWAGSAGCSTAGTDYVSTGLATASGASGTWVTWTLSAAGLELLEDWADGAKTNTGFYLRHTTGNRLNYRSSEYSTVSYRPKLDITYTPEPATMTLLGLGGLGLLIRRKRRA